MIKLSQNLRTLREGEKLKQSDLTLKLGVTQRKVSYWETGKIELWAISPQSHIFVAKYYKQKDK